MFVCDGRGGGDQDGIKLRLRSFAVNLGSTFQFVLAGVVLAERMLPKIFDERASVAARGSKIQERSGYDMNSLQ